MSDPHSGPSESTSSPTAGGAFETWGRKLDSCPEVQAAEETLRKAREQLRRAEEQYRAACATASERWERLRQRRLGDLLNDAQKFTRERPGQSLLIVGALGYLLGRLFRR